MKKKNFTQKLAAKRDELVKIDLELLSILGRRVALGRQIVELKKAEGLAVTDTKREQELLEKYQSTAVSVGLDKGFIDKVYALIFTEVKSH